MHLKNILNKLTVLLFKSKNNKNHYFFQIVSYSHLILRKTFTYNNFKYVY